MGQDSFALYNIGVKVRFFERPYKYEKYSFIYFIYLFIRLFTLFIYFYLIIYLFFNRAIVVTS